MAPEAHLQGLDPFDLLDREAARIHAHLSTVAETDWARASRCADWTIRDVLAHLLATEAYQLACVEGRVKDVMADLAARGATDLASANQMGIDDLAGHSTEQLLAEWREASAQSRRGFRERGDGVVDTSIGDYPCRWQAFHVASELATHADDMHVPVTAEERDARQDWRVRFSRFALLEAKSDLEVAAAADGARTRVRGQGIDVELEGDTFVEAVAGRLPDTASVDPTAREVLSTTP